MILPAVQAGSSIMPGKVNPVIPEAAISAAMTVLADHTAVSQACAAGNLELNPFLPLVADRLLNSIQLLAGAARSLAERCVEGMKVNEDVCRKHVASSTAAVTALIGTIGYDAAQGLLKDKAESGKSLKELAVEKGLLTEEAFDELVSAEAVMRLGSGGGS